MPLIEVRMTAQFTMECNAPQYVDHNLLWWVLDADVTP